MAKRPRPERERDEQNRVAAYCRNLGYLCTCALAERLDLPHRRKQAWAMGYSPGTPDMFIFEPRYGKLGLAIEMKRASGNTRVSPKQQEWLTELEQRGWVARVCYGSEEAIALIESYMSGPLPTLTGADAVTGHTSAP